MEVTINITELENLTAAMNSLAAAIAGKGNAVQAQPVQAAVQPAPVQMPVQQMVAQQTPVQMPVQQAPVQQTPVQMQVQQAPVPQAPVPGPIPTTAVPKEYTQDQLAVAMTGLVDRGMQPQVIGILNAMGCQTLLQVPKERYPELVLKLREAGAMI